MQWTVIGHTRPQETRLVLTYPTEDQLRGVVTALMDAFADTVQVEAIMTQAGRRVDVLGRCDDTGRVLLEGDIVRTIEIVQEGPRGPVGRTSGLVLVKARPVEVPEHKDGES